MSARKYVMDDRAVLLLRQRYDSTPEAITYLSGVLGVLRYTLKRWAGVLGLSRSYESRPWSEADVRYLEGNYHHLHIATIAKHLNRSVTAVALKAKRLRVRKGDEGYTARGLADALGMDAHKVVSWIDAGALRAKKRQTDRARERHDLSSWSKEMETYRVSLYRNGSPASAELTAEFEAQPLTIKGFEAFGFISHRAVFIRDGKLTSAPSPACWVVTEASTGMWIARSNDGREGAIVEARKRLQQVGAKSFRGHIARRLKEHGSVRVRAEQGRLM